MAFHKSMGQNAVGYVTGTFTPGYRLVMSDVKNLDSCNGVYPKTAITMTKLCW